MSMRLTSSVWDSPTIPRPRPISRWTRSSDHTFGFIQAVGIRRAVLVGHSRGALPVARIAADHPDMVSHLVILDSNTLAPPDPNTPERIDPEADREPPSREELKARTVRRRTSQSVKDYLTDAYLEAEYRIAHLPKIKEVARAGSTRRATNGCARTPSW